MPRLNLVTICLVCSIFLSACVQTTQFNTPQKKVIDKQKAVESYIALGMAYLQQGSRDSARRNFEKALDIDDGAHEAYNGMGLFYQLTGEVKLAEKSFLRALREESTFTRARVNYGAFLYTQKRYKQALMLFEQAAKDLSYERRARVLAYVGQTALKLDNKVRAKSAFEHALNVDNSLPLPMLELAQLSFDEKDYALAKQYIDRYAKVSKPSPKSLWLGVRIERIFGNKDKEASYAIALKNLHPYSKEYLEYKALLDQQARSND